MAEEQDLSLLGQCSVDHISLHYLVANGPIDITTSIVAVLRPRLHTAFFPSVADALLSRFKYNVVGIISLTVEIS